MKRLFLYLYDLLQKHPAIRYSALISSFLFFLLFAVQVKFEEDVTQFFPDHRNSKNVEKVFKNLKIKDKIIIMISGKTNDLPDADQLIQAGDRFKNKLWKDNQEYIYDIFAEVDENLITEVTDFIYQHLPVFLTEEDFERLENLTQKDEIENRIAANYRNLLSPASSGLKNILSRDPLGIGVTALENLRQLQLTSNYEIYNGHIFSKDMSTLLLIITPRYSTGATGKNEGLIHSIEENIKELSLSFSDINIEYFGGPSVSVYNARQIKKDTRITMIIALILIVVFITSVFKSRSAVFLILLPVIYGAVFSLACIWFIKGSVSAIAIGAGAAVFGVALSYSIHVLSHFNHVSSIRQLIEELAYPMTVGSFTTVGAFLGLLFTSSALLRDFGLFSSLALIGTTFFCLVFLPHLLKIKNKHHESGRFLQWIEKINSYSYEKNKWLIGGILFVFIICLFLSNKVTFDSNMQNLSFEPKHIKQAEQKLNRLFQSDNQTILFVSVGNDTEDALEEYKNTNQKLDRLKQKGWIQEYASAQTLLISPAEQQRRIQRWNQFWTNERKEIVKKQIQQKAEQFHFREDAFRNFFHLLDYSFTPYSFTELDSFVQGMDNWYLYADSLYMFITQVRMNDNILTSQMSDTNEKIFRKDKVSELYQQSERDIIKKKQKNQDSDINKAKMYSGFVSSDKVVIFDRAYFANQWIVAINNDFYLILYICSFLVFFTLLISYGRIELTFMTFTPMAVSWVIILGIMAITGTQFNIVNIILATFIFGLGDDFSIFIMDGLQQEYRTGKKILTSHKTAIFFSAITAVTGLGVLIFAKHPALQSISVISILGMATVVLVSYTILPILFRFFISNPAAKGNYPYTMKSLFLSLWFYNAFIVGCSLAIGVASILLPLPIKRDKKKAWFSFILMYMLRVFLKAAWVARYTIDNPEKETFVKPAVIIANHQSFIDILILLSLAPKMIMVTNNWVWNSPLIGRIVKYADFVQTAEGYESVLKELQKKVKEGYSVVIFPEGTRSTDLRIHRFHKGAFYIAEQLKLDIIPVLLYGTGMIISKKQPFYVKEGVLSTTILPRICCEDSSWGTSYQEKSKTICQWMRNRYEAISVNHSNTKNPWFYQKLVANYIYKGPVEEWYIRIKVRMEHSYTLFHQLIPEKARITDIGCGYGTLVYMLQFLSDKREITGLDYDEDKIALADHNFARNDKIYFFSVNAANHDLPESDVFVLNDILHYMDESSQRQLLRKCIEKLTPQGMLIIRDGDCDNHQSHSITRFTEFLSTRLTGFNKRENDLCFPSHEQFEAIAQEYNLHLEQKANDKYTSNTIYILKKRVDE